jgi:hypothetical protein
MEQEKQRQQQQEPQQLHPAVLDGMARLEDPKRRDKRHKLSVC